MNAKWFDFLLEKIPWGGNLSLTLAITLFIFLTALFLGKPLGFIARKIIQQFANKNPFFRTHIAPQIEKPISMMSIALIWLMILHFMPPLWKSLGGIPLFLSKPIIGGLKILIKTLIGSGLVWISYNLVDELAVFLMKRFFKDTYKESNEESNESSSLKNHFLPFISRFTKILVLCFGSLLVLQSLGINVISLLAGLGLGGIAIALAAKDSASNVLAYINIMLDKPFSVGDWICFKDIEGTVIEVGFRSAKLKTFYDSVITVPNSALTSANIDNMGKRKARRTRIYLSLQYNTSPEKIENFIAGIKEILISHKAIKKDYFQVYFTEFGASDLKIIMNFFLLVNDWESELKEKQSIFMAVLKLAKEIKVNFAFPTQTIHLANEQKANEPKKENFKNLDSKSESLKEKK